MSVYGLMRTGVSGMEAQANRLAAVADNVANAKTTGYKRASTEFASLVLDNHGSSYTSGGVETKVRYHITAQGNLEYSTSATDLAIRGEGFFLVSDANDRILLTRAGGFVPNGEGQLINAGGYRLMVYPPDVDAVVNGPAGLIEANIRGATLEAVPSTAGRLTTNLPSDAAIIAPADLPSAGGTEFSHKTSVVAVGSQGQEVVLDIYYSKMATDQWEIAVFDNSHVFPAGLLSSEVLEFDPATGQFDTTGPSPTSIDFTMPGAGGANFTLDLEGTTQLYADYQILDVEINGTGASAIDRLDFAANGTVYAVFENGSRNPLYRMPIATVPSPDRLQPTDGTTFQLTSDSGDLRIGFPGDGGLGEIRSGALEGSNVDIATELTLMIESQRNYTANSKVFQTGSELLEVLVNLKR